MTVEPLINITVLMAIISSHLTALVDKPDYDILICLGANSYVNISCKGIMKPYSRELLLTGRTVLGNPILCQVNPSTYQCYHKRALNSGDSGA